MSEAAVAAVRAVHEAWLAAELRGDPEALLDLCTSDVQWLVPGGGLTVGREAGRRHLAGGPGRLEAITTTVLQIETSGDLAYKTSSYEARYRLPGRGEVQVASGTHLWILRREGEVWRVALVTWQAEE